MVLPSKDTVTTMNDRPDTPERPDIRDRPYVLISCATSIDGYLDDASDERLLLSGPEDFDRVDAVRSGCDAILVGAATIRADNPRLMVRSAARRAARVARGLSPTPIKVTMTARGDLDPDAAFFATGDVEKIVYCATPLAGDVGARLRTAATVVDAGQPIDLTVVLADLARRGTGRLMVEGGGSTLTGFLTSGLADELHLVIAPFFVGNPQAPRFVRDGAYPWSPRRPAKLIEVRQIGEVALHRYALSDRFAG